MEAPQSQGHDGGRSASDDLSQSQIDGSNNMQKEDDREIERRTLAAKENKAVSRQRIIVFLVLLLMATLVVTGVYRYTKNDQWMEFEKGYRGSARKVVESFQTTIARKLEAVDALSVAFTSHAQSTGSSFPNVTLPDFEIRGSNTRILAESPVINYQTIVTHDQREGWEAYVAVTKDYYRKSVESGVNQRVFQDQYYGFTPGENSKPSETITEISDHLYNIGTNRAPALNASVYLPIWQISPAIPDKVSFLHHMVHVK